MLKGFREFISRGNMIDMAVGVVMGSAVTAVVNAIVKDLINPLIAMIFGKPNMDNLLNFTFNNATISFGGILSALLNFLLIAAAVYFVIVVPINKVRDMSKALAEKMGIASEDEEAEEKKQSEANAEMIELLQGISGELRALNGKTDDDVSKADRAVGARDESGMRFAASSGAYQGPGGGAREGTRP